MTKEKVQIENLAPLMVTVGVVAANNPVRVVVIEYLGVSA